MKKTFNIMKKSAKEIFESVFGKSRNFITPNIERYEHIRNGAVEISSEQGFLTNRTIYGVTVVKWNARRDDLSRSFRNRRVMEAYIYGLKRGLWN